jgi:two-component system, cell cycle response regulator
MDALLGFSFAVYGVYAVAILLTSPGDALNDALTRWVYTGLFVLSVAIAAARAVRVPTDRVAWSVVTLSLASWCFAELYDVIVQPTAYPSVADFGWLLFYPLLYVGIVLLVRRRATSIAGHLWLDGVTASVGAAALGSALLFEAVVQATDESRAAVATNLAYPLGDVLLLSAVFGVFTLAGWRIERPWFVLGAGVVATTVADAIYLFELTSYQAGTAIDILWPLSTLLIGTAGWVAARGREARFNVAGRSLLAVPMVCALVGIGILIVDHFDRLNLLAVTLATTTLLLVLVRLAFTFRENAQLYALTRHESMTDELTGLGNRRRLLGDLERLVASERVPLTMLAIFDLNGFKSYNDSFGHPAGDALLARLGEKLAGVPQGRGGAYRLGGDEFCVVAHVEPGYTGQLLERSSDALSERGEGFDITSSYGAVLLPDETTDVIHALALADERLYSQKHNRRLEHAPSVHAFLESLAIREPDLLEHPDGLARLAAAVAERLGLGGDGIDAVFRAARLHDLGKLAVPEEILNKRDPLDEREWEFIHQHTIVGERILRASPAFRSVAPIVRSSHENWDGSGYPDGLHGEEIPLPARIIRVCDAFIAMTSKRPYRDALTVAAALTELEREAGSHFDPDVVRVLVAQVLEATAGRAA